MKEKSEEDTAQEEGGGGELGGNMGKSNEGTGERVRRKGVGEWEGMGE